mgnify:CR=1 FL=1
MVFKSIKKMNKLKLIFLSSFPLNFKNLNILSSKQMNVKIFTKNFLTFICLLDKIFKTKTTILKKINIIILPKFKKTILLLRAPFRHKLTKKNYSCILWKFSLIFNLSYCLLNLDNFFFAISFWLKYLIFFETNICSLQKLVVKQLVKIS